MITRNPLLTIITVVKNGGRSLLKTIDSIGSLKYDNIEYIVVDGGCSDETKEIVQSRCNNTITKYIREPDAGIYDAMNKGWRVASEKGCILFLGVGDKILSLPADLQKLNLGSILYGRVWLGEKRLFRSRVDIQLKFANTLHHQALIIPKSLNPDPPFNLTYRVYADFDFNQRLLVRGANFIFDDKFISYALPGGLSKRYSEDSYKISYNNFGLFWGTISYLFFLYNRIRMRS